MDSNSNKLEYEELLLKLQVELVKLQKHVISNRDRLLIIFEGRDAAGKDGCIKRIVEHLSPRDTHVVALGKPSEQEQGEWYFQRYISHLPTAGEIVCFNRSWYNRAGVEPVMGFCDKIQYARFMKTVNTFEDILVDDGLTILKYYLDISKKEQEHRFQDRKTDPLKQWKLSPIDEIAQEKWGSYSKYRDDMLLKTNHPSAPWTLIRANNKKLAHLNLIRDLLSQIDYPGKKSALLKVDPDVVIKWPSNASKLPKLEK
jgi:polyphosphate kinase 2